MTYKLLPQFAGYPDIGTIVPVPTKLSDLPVVPGTIVTAIDEVFGPGEFIFARCNAATYSSQSTGVILPVWDSANLTHTWNVTELPNTANLGRPVVVNVSGDVTLGQYAWWQLSGIAPIEATASLGADTAIGITATGQIGAVTAGKQILNARSVTAATQTVAKAGTGKSGDTKIYVPNLSGWFIGGYLSGTGVGAAARISAMNPNGPNGPEVTASVANSADIAGTVTLTYNNGVIFYNVVHFNRPFAQGQIL